jgi:hypothetical protein
MHNQQTHRQHRHGNRMLPRADSSEQANQGSVRLLLVETACKPRAQLGQAPIPSAWFPDSGVSHMVAQVASPFPPVALPRATRDPGELHMPTRQYP